MAMPRRWADDLVPLFLPDVIGAKRICGRAPEIVQAERMIPIGKRELRSVRLPSGISFNPEEDDIFCTLVEEGERLRRGDGAWKNVPEAVRETLYPGWKAGNLGLAYDLFAQTNVIDKAGDAQEEVTLLFDEGERRRRTPHPEDPGPFFCLPLAALVTSCGRLLLAMIDELVAQKGGTVAMGHTDSAHIIATKSGGPLGVEIVDTDPKTGDGARRYQGNVHALSWGDVDEIAAAFAQLNPFDPALMPGSPLKIKTLIDENGCRIETHALVLTPMHYCLVGPEGDLIDGTASLLGMYLPPIGNPETWRREAWRHILELWQGSRINTASRPWLGYSAVSTKSLTRPAFAAKVKDVAERPFDPFLVAQAVGRKDGEKSKTAVVIAPYETDPAVWPGLPWRFYETGELVVCGKPGVDGWRWQLVTIEKMLGGFAQVHPHASLDASGMPCHGYTRGPLQRMSIRDGKKFLITKESLTWSDDPAQAFATPLPEVHAIEGTENPDESCDWNAVRAALEIVGPATVARRMGLDPRSANHWISSRSLPENPRSVAEAVVACATEAGLVLPSELALPADAICTRLPERAAIVQNFLAEAVEGLALAAGGIRALERDTGIPEKTLRYWRALGSDGSQRPIRSLNVIAAKLAKVAKVRIREAKRRIRFEKGPVGDWQAIYCWLLLLAGDPRPQPAPADTERTTKVIPLRRRRQKVA
jgi:hypothetical protein